MLAHFYDIESLQNVFSLCNFKPEENHIDVYILSDLPCLMESKTFHKDLLQRIHDRNYNFQDGTISVYDLSTEEANRYFAKEFGVSNAKSVNDLFSKSMFPAEFRPVCDTDPGYSEDKNPYLFGYNSFNYDTTMLAQYFYKVFPSGLFQATTAKFMREFNNKLFTAQYRDNMPSALKSRKPVNGGSYKENVSEAIRRNMIASGRHLDVARLNEKQQKVGLKRLLGMMGWQILESNKLQTGQDIIENQDQLYDLIAYNVSDVVNLKKLFEHKVYTSSFELKRGLLYTYPELIYEQQPGAYKPDIRPEKVRRDRLTIDSSSAQFATKTLCPYGHLSDIPTVSFMYPSERKAEELGIPRVNVLEETRKFFYELFPQENLREQFDVIYRYYKSIEGKNFNGSKNYQEDYGSDIRVYDIKKDIPNVNTCLPYFDSHGNPTSCFVTFSVGGIHGAEYNKALFEHDLAEWAHEKEELDWVKSQFELATDLVCAKTVEMPDGTVRPAKDFVKSGATRKKAEWRDIESKKPKLFVTKKSGDEATKLCPGYVFTSADRCNHEDFTSYYPNLLRMMEAFYNEGLGYDRYGEIFNQKSLYGKKMKDPSISADERQHYSILRNGVKLILNSASGAGDTNFESNIRMNNQIISMRIIGQLYSFRIGIAQAYAGSRVISTNTDGLYSVLDPELNNRILAEQSERIHVEIEPEETFLISKDSNNRIEYNSEKRKVDSASGGTLACQSGTDPTKSLAHPAVIDWALCQYLILAAQHKKGLSLSDPFDREVGSWILNAAKDRWDTVKWLNMFQNILASSIGSMQYIYGIKPGEEEPIILQHYNRVFIMKDNTPGALHLYSAYGRAITPATTQKRERDGEDLVQHEPLALSILHKNGVESIPAGREAATKKINSIGDSWFMFIENHALESMTEEQRQFIRDNIDMEKYLDLLEDCFEQNWRNILPEKKSKNDAPASPLEDSSAASDFQQMRMDM